MPMASIVGKNVVDQVEQGFSLKYLMPLLVVFVWVFEYKRRAAGALNEIAMGKRLLRQLIPELVCLILLLTIIAVSLAYRREADSPQDPDYWKSVKKEWPLFICADTLIGLQAMLRVVFLLSASFRRNAAQLSPLDGEAAAFFLLASISRVSLLCLSPRDVYHLDGPLGGDMNVTVEVTALLLLLPLGCRVFKKGSYSVVAMVLSMMALAVVANRNHFALADHDQAYLDVLWLLGFILEIAAAFAFHIRSSWMKGCYSWDAFTGFAHFMLPLMQALPTYFILVAFAPPFTVVPTLVGQGRPFEVCQYGGLLQILVYLITAIVYFVSCTEEKQMSTFAAVVPIGEAPPGDECVICLGSCEGCGDVEAAKPRWRRLNCGHHFHENCVHEWLKKSTQCPICRQLMYQKEDTKSADGGAGESFPLLVHDSIVV